jgi:predicted membrane protein
MNEPNNRDDQRDDCRSPFLGGAFGRKSRMSQGGVFAGHGDSSTHVIFGLIVLLVGVLILLENLGFFYARSIFTYWPVILIAIGIGRIYDSRSWQNLFGAAVIGGVGGIILAHNLGFLPWNFWRLLWPFLLICLGVYLLLRGIGFADPKLGLRSSTENSASTYSGEASTSNNVLHEEVIFGGINRRIQAQDFQGGKATAVFGGVEIDLRGSVTTRDEVVIEANAVFGGVELTVPESWEVIVRGTGVLGGYEDKTHPLPPVPGAKRPRLIIRGGAVFGGVTVR